MSNDEIGAPKDIDIDELEVRVFMLVKNPAGMQSAVNFLTRRGWDTVCQSNIGKSIDTIVRARPEVVLVSVDHPNPNVTRLPQLLSQSINSITIGFSESGSPMGQNKLKNSGFIHRFSGYPSGPSFHRFIRQILDRTHNPHKFEDKQAKRNHKKRNKNQGDDSIEVKGTSGYNSDTMNFGSDQQKDLINVKGGNSSGPSVGGSENQGAMIQKSAFGKSRGKNSTTNFDDLTPTEQKRMTRALEGFSENEKEKKKQQLLAMEPIDRKREINELMNTPPEQRSKRERTLESISPEEKARKEEEFNREIQETMQEALGDAGDKSLTKRSTVGKIKAGAERKKTNSAEFDEGGDGEPKSEFSDRNEKSNKAKGSEGKETASEEKPKKKRPQRRLYPWQKADDPEPDNIKDQDSRPGASFELKQSRKDIESGDEEKEKQSKKDGPDGPNLEKGAGPGEELSANQEAQKAKEFEAQQEAEKAKENQAENRRDASERKSKQEGEDSDELAAKQKNEDNDLSADKKDKKEDGREAAGKPKSKTSAPSREPLEEKEKPPAGEPISDELPQGPLEDPEDKFRRLMKEALAKVVDEADVSVRIDIEDVEKIGVIPLNTKFLSGYVVVSRSGIGFDINTELLDQLLEVIEATLPAHGVDVTCQKPFVMETEKFTFGFWKKHIGLFTVFEQSAREEIALTFVQTEVSIPEMQVSKHDSSMVTIEVKDLDVSTPVNFNTYIYFERNKKFYKYLNDGRTILDEQKKRLSKNLKSNQKLHIAKDDFRSFQQYFAKNIIQNLLKSLSNKIDEEKKAA